MNELRSNLTRALEMSKFVIIIQLSHSGKAIHQFLYEPAFHMRSHVYVFLLPACVRVYVYVCVCDIGIRFPVFMGIAHNRRTVICHICGPPVCCTISGYVT